VTVHNKLDEFVLPSPGKKKWKSMQLCVFLSFLRSLSSAAACCMQRTRWSLFVREEKSIEFSRWLTAFSLMHNTPVNKLLSLPIGKRLNQLRSAVEQFKAPAPSNRIDKDICSFVAKVNLHPQTEWNQVVVVGRQRALTHPYRIAQARIV
jgi:hypothetical protein